MLSAFDRDLKRLGGQLGITAALHTLGQNLSRHLHLHCLVPGGAWNAERRFEAARGYYPFRVRALSRKFRRRMLAELRQARSASQLARISRPHEYSRRLDELAHIDWVVYAKPCLGYREQVLSFLADYTHCIALSDRRLIGGGNERIALHCRDYTDKGRNKLLMVPTRRADPALLDARVAQGVYAEYRVMRSRRGRSRSR